MTTEHGRGHRVIVILLLLVILALAVIAGLLALKLSRREDPRLAGVWQMRADLTETARTRADTWLQRAAMGEQVPAAEYLPALSVTVRLTLSPDGSWSREIRDGEYESARSAAERGLAKALRELLCLRIADAGRPSETAAEAERRVQRVLGMIWLPAVLYPEYCDYDVEAEVKEAYALLYGCELTDGQYAALTEGAFLQAE